MKKVTRIAMWGALAAAGAAIAGLAATNAVVAAAARGRCYDDVAAIPARRIGVVLGTSKYVASGRENLHFRYRMDAAERLFKSGKVQYLIVSGDNSTRRYNEPVTMRADLIRRGVPADRIYLDYAGFRTLDSIVRAAKVFGAAQFTVVSQRAHNERAIFIAASQGLDVIGFDARDVPLRVAARGILRERLARVLAVFDVVLFKRQPKFLGPVVEVGESTPDAEEVNSPEA